MALTLPLPVSNAQTPVAMVPVDPVTGAVGCASAVNYTPISTNGTTVVKSGPGLFSGLSVITAGATSNTLIIYDNTSGSGNVILGTYTNVAVGSYAPSPGGACVRCLTGITVVSATGTAAVGNVFWD